MYAYPWWTKQGLLLRLPHRVQSFIYNFVWPDYVGLFDGWLARCAVAVPLLGYAILYNDTVAGYFEFTKLAGSSPSPFGLSPVVKLKLTYFGLVILGASNVFYHLFRPHVMKLGRDEFEYVSRLLEHATLGFYIQIHERIRYHGHASVHGKYYDDEYDAFMRDCLGDRTGDREHALIRAGDWTSAKARHEGLLRSMLIDNYSYGKRQRQGLLAANVAMALIGFALIAVPGLDLFVRVVLTLF